MISLQFIGIGSAFTPDLGNTSACLRRGDRLWLIDCGSTVFGELLKRQMMKDVRSVTVLVTHLHADHVGSLGTLISYAHYVQPMGITVVHPLDTLVTLLKLNGIRPERYQFVQTDQYREEGLRASFFPVRHTSSLQSWGIELTDGEQSVYFSGDAGEVPQEIWRRFLQGEIARVYQDCALHAGGAHATLDHFSQMLSQKERSRFYPIHWEKDYQSLIRENGWGNALEAET